MPIVIIGNTTQGVSHSFTGDAIEYNYPHGLNFSPRSRRHQNIVARLMQLAEESYGIMSQRHPQWREIDEMMTAFIPLSDYEKALKQRGGSKDQFHGRNRPVSVVVPYSYATMETVMTYLVQAFFQNPTFQYDGVGREDTIKVKLLELAVDAQARRYKAALAMHTSMTDSLKYGIGISTFKWKETYGKRPVDQQVVQETEFGEFLGTTTERTNVETLLFEGNKILAIDPYRFLPDPNVSINDIQDGEFCGWVALTTYQDLITEERDDEDVFNIKYLNDTYFRQRFSKFTPDLSARESKQSGESTGAGIKTNWTNYVTLTHLYVNIIPEEWKLPGDPVINKDGEYPEKWLFTIANDTLLVRAARHNLNHNAYPVAACAPDSDGYSITPVSRMEMLHGLQEGMNWLYNSHIANVRKTMNDMLIVDPSLVVMKDLQNPQPGALIRLRRQAWGRGVDQAVKQLVVQDVTRNNISDSTYLMDMMQRVSAAVDSTQGVVRSGGERRSATEFRTTAANALSRLEHIAKMISMQYMNDLSYMMASHTQQFMSQPVFTQILGEWPAQMDEIYNRNEGVKVTPEDILVDYDVIIRDGSVPTAGAANSDLLVQLFQIVTANQELTQQFDVVKMFTRIATMLGDKNAEDFVRRGGDVVAATAPDEEVMRQAEAGNLVPLNGG